MDDLQSLIDYGLTVHEFNSISESAKSIVNSGNKGELMRVFCNQVVNNCKMTGQDPSDIFDFIIGFLDGSIDRGGYYLASDELL